MKKNDQTGTKAAGARYWHELNGYPAQTWGALLWKVLH